MGSAWLVIPMFDMKFVLDFLFRPALGTMLNVPARNSTFLPVYSRIPSGIEHDRAFAINRCLLFEHGRSFALGWVIMYRVVSYRILVYVT